MKSWAAVPLLAVLAASIILAGCGGGDSRATPDAATPAGTKELTATPAATEPQADGNATAPAPADPQLDEQLTEFARSDLQIQVPAAGTYSIDPQTLAANAGDVPSCDNFQFDFTWQVTDPYPPDGVSLEWAIQRDTGNITLSRDPSGEQSVGCDSIQAENKGSSPITVAIKYAIGGLP